VNEHDPAVTEMTAGSFRVGGGSADKGVVSNDSRCEGPHRPRQPVVVGAVPPVGSAGRAWPAELALK
jgi:hypothetical protein